MSDDDIWNRRIRELEAMHAAQRKDLEEKLAEAREKLLHAEKIVKGLYPAPHLDAYVLPNLWVLAQDPLTRAYFEAVI